MSDNLLSEIISEKFKIYKFVPLTELTTGNFDDALLLKDRFWLIILDHALIYVGKHNGYYTPQCNTSENVIKHRA